MSKEKKIDKNATIQNILNKCNSSIGFSINMDKFKFLKECAKFCGVPVVYV